MLSVNVGRVNVKFCVRIGKSATETYNLLKKVHGTQVFKWFKRFKEGREEIRDNQRLGRPSKSPDADIKKVREIDWKNCHLSIQAVAEIVNIDKETIRQIFHNNFIMKKVCSKWC
jgi:transposase